MKYIKKLIITLILFILCILCGCEQETPTIDINKYVKINIDGYDSVGTMEVALDVGQLKSDYLLKLAYKSPHKQLSIDPETFSISRIGYDPFEDLVYYLSYDVNKDTNLSNGDIVHIYWTCDEQELDEVFNCKIKYSNIDVEVKDLPLIDTFDPFQYVEIDSYGIIPEAGVGVDVDYDIEYMKYLDFDVVTSLDEYDHNNLEERYAMKPKNLQNGDTVYIKAYLNCPVKTFADEYGMIPNPNTKEFTVSGIGSYCNDLEELPDDLIKELNESSGEVIQQYIDNEMPNPQNLKNLTYIGYYYTVLNDGVSIYDEKNRIYLLYKMEIKDKYSNET